MPLSFLVQVGPEANLRKALNCLVQLQLFSRSKGCGVQNSPQDIHSGKGDTGCVLETAVFPHQIDQESWTISGQLQVHQVPK